MIIDELIDLFVKKTKTRVKRIEEKLYQAVLEHYNDNLNSEDGIVTIGKNLKVIDSLWKAISNKLERDIFLLGKYVVDSINELFDSTIDEFEESVRDIEISEAVRTKVLSHAKKSIVAKTDLSGTYSQIKSKSVSLMSKYDGISLKELRETLQKQIVIEGIVNRYWANWTADIYSQYQRASSNEVRTKLKLIHAMYEGGLIDNSRNFCIEKNGKVFTEEEIQGWENQTWVGKNEGYDPFTDCGGYNCRHRLRWISKELAEQLRPELKK